MMWNIVMEWIKLSIGVSFVVIAVSASPNGLSFEVCKRKYLGGDIPKYKIPLGCIQYMQQETTTINGIEIYTSRTSLPTKETKSTRRPLQPGLSEQRRREGEREYEDPDIIIIKPKGRGRANSNPSTEPSTPSSNNRQLAKDKACVGSHCAEQSKDDMHEMLRTMAVLAMAIIATLTVIILALAVFCVVRRRIEECSSSSETESGKLVNVAGVGNGTMDNREYMRPPTSSLPMPVLNNQNAPNGVCNGVYAINKDNSPTHPVKLTQGAYEYSVIDGCQKPIGVEPDIIMGSIPNVQTTCQEPLSQPTRTEGHYYFKLQAENSRNFDKGKRSPSISSSRQEVMDVSKNVNDSSVAKNSAKSYEKIVVLKPLDSYPLSEQYDHLDHSGAAFRITPAANTSKYYDKLGQVQVQIQETSN